jgi:hypothetical protein
MKFLVLFSFLYLLRFELRAQEFVVDPLTSGAIIANTSTINGQLNTTNNNLSAISRGQMAVSAQLVIVNNLQAKIYKGLSEVASVINNLNTIKEIGQCGSDIVTDVGSAVQLARSNPALLLFAEQGARDFQSRAVKLAAEVSAFVLQGGKNNLMDSGERGKLLNHIQSEMQILRGIAYGMKQAMYWAKMNGIWRELNPWATWQNQDVRIANEVLNNAKYLKK